MVIEDIKDLKSRLLDKILDIRLTNIAATLEYYIYFYFSQAFLKNDSSELPPTREYLRNMEDNVEIFEDFVENFIGEDEGIDDKNISYSIDAMHVFNEFSDKLDERVAVMEKTKNDIGIGYALSSLLLLGNFYGFIKNQIVGLKNEENSDNCGLLDEENIMRAVGYAENRYNVIMTMINYSIVFITANIMKSRKNRIGAKKMKELADERKEKLKELLKQEGLFNIKGFESLTGKGERKTRMTVFEKAKRTCDVLSDKAIKRYINEIKDDLPQ